MDETIYSIKMLTNWNTCCISYDNKDATTKTKMQKNYRNKEASGKMILIKVGEVKDNFNSGSVISPHSI